MSRRLPRDGRHALTPTGSTHILSYSTLHESTPQELVKGPKQLRASLRAAGSRRLADLPEAGLLDLRDINDGVILVFDLQATHEDRLHLVQPNQEDQLDNRLISEVLLQASEGLVFDHIPA
jgi:hypothetical protein